MPEGGSAAGNDGVLVAFVDQGESSKESAGWTTPGLSSCEKGALATGGGKMHFPIFDLETRSNRHTSINVADPAFTNNVSRIGYYRGSFTCCGLAHDVDWSQVERC
jgi:hypothetical protein